MALKTSKRGAIPPFIVMDVMRAANRREAETGDVLHLELGEPATGAPRGVIDAARAALDAERLGYTESLGHTILRERISRYYQDTQNVAVDPERIVVTTGSSAGFVLSFLSAFDVGDRVALADPGYPAYRNILLALGIEPVCIPVGRDTRFQPTPEMLDRVAGPLDGLIVASPSNPTGTMLYADDMAGLAHYCDDRGIRLISDEIYHGITYAGPGVSALRYLEDSVVINSFSKYFSMTGWRIGWMVVPEALKRSVECLAQNIYISVPTLSQHAALAAFDCTAELDANVARYEHNRRVLLDGLPGAGFDSLAPADGAFYLYADIAHLTNDSEAFCRQMLADTGVATTPGTDFDQARGRSFMRISFSGPTAAIEEAVRRLTAWKPPPN
ncbi:MAG: pyridoxal phosphate-dependent aminotransferase [Alphaproteobacteria bacterium]